MCAELIGTAFADRLYKKEYEMIQENILELVKYGLSTGLVDPEDKVYTINRLLELFQVDEIEDAVFEKVENLPAWTQEEAEGKLEGILAEMMDYAYENGLMAENSIVYKDLFDTKIMGCLVPEPSSVRKTFRDLYEHTSPLAATDYFYKLSCDSNYIRRQRIKKDRKWTTDTEFGTLDITINLSKPEKDPKAIAAAKNAKQSAYPKCQLCKENEGYAGRVNHPARQNHRIIPLTINNSDWFFLGMELGGSLKNVIALAAGMADGLGYGDNTKAALITRGIAEIAGLAVKMGAKVETLCGLTGIGDLIVTCESRHSRNRKAGMLIGQGYTMKQATDEVKMVVEGIYSAKAALALAKKYDVELPIIEEVNKVLFDDKPAKEGVKDLMVREKRVEHLNLKWEN